MRHLLFAVAFMFYSFQSFGQSQELKSFKEPFYLMAEECENLLANMRTGKLIKGKGDKYTMACKPTTELTIACDYLFEDPKNGSKMNLIYQGGIIGLQAIFQNEDATDVFIINLTANAYYGDSKVVLEEGLIRGRKVCAGNYISESTYLRLKAKK